MKRYTGKVIALMMAALIAAQGMCGCSSVSAATLAKPAAAETEEASETETEKNLSADELKDDLSDAAEKLLKDHSQDEGKTETVYIVANADGSEKETIVSSWLKNPDKLDEIEDVSDLKDITNTKGDETFTAKGSKLTWQANGKDIWYQGKTDKQLPLTTKISYELDGKEIKADELAGKDGHPFHDQWWLAGAWEALQKDAGSWGMKSRKVLGGADC